MARTDGGTKVIYTADTVTIAQRTADAMNANGNLTGNGTGFRFGVLPQSNGTAAITATGPWHLPGNQRPAHGTLQTWAMGYAQCLADVAGDLELAERTRTGLPGPTGRVGDPS